MPVEIELTETAPGRWEVVKRLPGTTHAEEPLSEEELEARREAFFDSLAGHSTRRKHHFEDFDGTYVIFGLFSLPVIVVFLDYALTALTQ